MSETSEGRGFEPLSRHLSKRALHVVSRPHRCMDAPVGSTVRIEIDGPTGRTSVSGQVIPPAAPGHITLKLLNGYNVSHLTTSVTAMAVLSGPSESTTEAEPAPLVASGLPHVRIVHTGGTIASKVDYSTGAVSARFEPSELLSSVPELGSIADISAVKVGNLFSDDLRPKHWNAIAEACAQAFTDGARGVVVTHGTDTLHYTAAALSFAFAGAGGRPAGPIVLVGSQRSPDRGSSDAPENLMAAVHWAANGPVPTGQFGDAVVVVMHRSSDDGMANVLPGVATRKMHSTRRDAFRALNVEPLATVTISTTPATIQLNQRYDAERSRAADRAVTEAPTPFLPDLNLPHVVATPWLRAEHIESLAATGPAAIIVHGTGLGHLPISDPDGDLPENREMWKVLMRASNRRLPIVVTTQCIEGPVDMNVYAKGREQRSLNVLGHGISSVPETTAIKVHHLLSRGLDLHEHLTTDLCGENPLQY